MADVFLRKDICRIFHNKYVVFMGNSVVRSMYKDIVKLLQENVFLSDLELRKKGERCFHGDTLLEGGVLQGLSNGTQYREVREYRSDYVLVRFYFLTRCYNDYVESIIKDFEKKPSPDFVVMSSVLWDLTRYGENSVPQFKSDIETVFSRLSSSLPSRCLFLWLTCLPVSQVAKGGVFIPEVEYLRNLTRLETHFADYHCAQLASTFGFDVLDLCYFLRDHLHRRALDGIHWDMSAHRRITNLILTHVSQAWGLPLPGVAVDDNAQENQPEPSIITHTKTLSEDSNQPEPLNGTFFPKFDRCVDRKLRKIKRRNLKMSSRKDEDANKDIIDNEQRNNFKEIDADLYKENVKPILRTSTEPIDANRYNQTVSNAALFEQIENLRRGIPYSANTVPWNNDDSFDLRNSLQQQGLQNRLKTGMRGRDTNVDESSDSRDQPSDDLRNGLNEFGISTYADFIENQFAANDLRNNINKTGLLESKVFGDEPYCSERDGLKDSNYIGNDSYEQDPYHGERKWSDSERNSFSTPRIKYGLNHSGRDRIHSPDDNDTKSDQTRKFKFGDTSDHFSGLRNNYLRFELKSPKRSERSYECRDRMYNVSGESRAKDSDSPTDRDSRFKRNHESQTKMALRHGSKTLNNLARGNHRDDHKPRLGDLTERSEKLEFRQLGQGTKSPKDLMDHFDRDDQGFRMRSTEPSRSNYRIDRYRNENPLDSHNRRSQSKFDRDLRHQPNEQNHDRDEWPRSGSVQGEYCLLNEPLHGNTKLTRSNADDNFRREHHSSLNMPLQENCKYGQHFMEHNISNAFNIAPQMHHRGSPKREASSARSLDDSPRKTFSAYRPSQQDLNRSPTSYSGGIFETKRLGRRHPHRSPPHTESPSRTKSFGSVVDDVMEAIHSRTLFQTDNSQEYRRQNFNMSVPKRIVFLVENNKGWDAGRPPISKRVNVRSLPSGTRSRLKSIEFETSYPDDIPQRNDVSEFYLDFDRDRSDDDTVWMDSYRR